MTLLFYSCDILLLGWLGGESCAFIWNTLLCFLDPLGTHLLIAVGPFCPSSLFFIRLRVCWLTIPFFIPIAGITIGASLLPAYIGCLLSKRWKLSSPSKSWFYLNEDSRALLELSLFKNSPLDCIEMLRADSSVIYCIYRSLIELPISGNFNLVSVLYYTGIYCIELVLLVRFDFWDSFDLVMLWAIDCLDLCDDDLSTGEFLSWINSGIDCSLILEVLSSY